MKTITNVRLDLCDPNYGAWIGAIQNDCNCRAIQASLQNNGRAWFVPKGVSAAITYRKPDGTKGWYDTLADGTAAIKINGNHVTAILAAQMLTTPGKIQAAIVFTDNMLNQLTTFPFVVSVEENPFVGAEESEDYIRIAWLENKLDEYLLLAKESGEFDGKDGQTPSLLEDSVSYQAGESGSTPPEGQWSEAIPEVPRGNYLWTRRVTQWSESAPITDYSVSYMGLDGKGAVSSVNQSFPDSSGNVKLVPGDIGALSVAGGTMEGPLNLNGQRLTGLCAPEDQADAARKVYVDDMTRQASPYNWLDNGDFRSPVNQRGKVSYDSTGYSIDRWKIDNGGVNMTIGNGYVSVTRTASDVRNISQVLGDVGGLLGRNITFVLKCTGSVAVVLGYFANGSMTYADAIRYDDLLIGTLFLPADAQSATFFIQPQDMNENKLYWAAVYEGTYSVDTLPDFQAKGYGAEMSECRRYYQEYRGIYFNVVQGQSGELPFWYGQPMRIVPTVTVQAEAYVNGQWIDDPSVSPTPTATACRVYISANSAIYKIDMTLSADL